MTAAHAQRSLMHLLATTSGVIDGAAEAIDLGQDPADIVVLSAADSELAALARAQDSVGALPAAARQSSAAAAQSFGRSLHREDAGHGEAHRAAPAGGRKLLELRARADRGTGARSRHRACGPARRCGSRSGTHARARRWRRSIASACASIWWRAARTMRAASSPIARISLDGTEAPAPARDAAEGRTLPGHLAGRSAHGGASSSTVPSWKARRQRPSTRWSMRLPTRGIGCKAFYVASLKDAASVSLHCGSLELAASPT